MFRQEAFTLLELLIVIAIIAVLAAAGALNFTDYRVRREFSATSQEIVLVLRNAQNRSLSQESGSRWGVYFENPASGRGFYELFSGTSYSSSSVVFRANLKDGVKFDIPAAGATSTIIFSPVAGLPISAASVKISLKNNSSVSSTIIVNANGQIQY